MESPVSVVYVESNKMSQRKRTVIDILRESPGFVSGELISARLGISRNAVHKHVNSLRKRGYQILGISRRGYKLEAEPVKLVVPVITEMTQGSVFGRSFRYYDEIESTNVEAKELAMGGAPEGTVVIAECQRAGRGRLGRRWTSPAGKGLLFSVILRPNVPMSRGAHADDRRGGRGGEGDRASDRRLGADQVAERPLRRRPQGGRHPAGGRRRTGCRRVDRRRHRYQRQHRVRRTARRSAPHGDLSQDGHRTAGRPQRAARPHPALAGVRLPRGARSTASIVRSASSASATTFSSAA